MSLVFSPSGEILQPSGAIQNVEDWSQDDLLDYVDKLSLFRARFGTSPEKFLEAERDLRSACEVTGVRYIAPLPSDGPAHNMARRDRIALSAKRSLFERRLRRRCEKCGVSYEPPTQGETLVDRGARISALNSSIRRAQARIRRRNKKSKSS